MPYSGGVYDAVPFAFDAAFVHSLELPVGHKKRDDVGFLDGLGGPEVPGTGARRQDHGSLAHAVNLRPLSRIVNVIPRAKKSPGPPYGAPGRSSARQKRSGFLFVFEFLGLQRDADQGIGGLVAVLLPHPLLGPVEFVGLLYRVDVEVIA